MWGCVCHTEWIAYCLRYRREKTMPEARWRHSRRRLSSVVYILQVGNTTYSVNLSSFGLHQLTHCGRVTHICVSNLCHRWLRYCLLSICPVFIPENAFEENDGHLGHGLWTTRTQDNSYPGQLVPKTTRTQDNSYPRRLVPKTTRTQENSYPGQLVPRTTRTQQFGYYSIREDNRN